MALYETVFALPNGCNIMYVRVPYDENCFEPVDPDSVNGQKFTATCKEYNKRGRVMEHNAYSGPGNWTKDSHPLVTTFEPLTKLLSRGDFLAKDPFHSIEESTFMEVVQEKAIPLTNPDCVVIVNATGWNKWTAKGVEDNPYAPGLQENVLCQCRTKEDLLEALSVAIELGSKHWDKEATEKVKAKVQYVVHGKGCGAELGLKEAEQIQQHRPTGRIRR